MREQVELCGLCEKVPVGPHSPEVTGEDPFHLCSKCHLECAMLAVFGAESSEYVYANIPEMIERTYAIAREVRARMLATGERARACV